MKVKFLVTLIILYSQICAAQTIYVSPNGNDANNGSRGRPVASLETARNLARTIHTKVKNRPVNISIASGEYFFSKPLVLLASENDENLIFSGDSTNKPVFYGGYRIGPFRKVSDSIWKADVPQVRKTGVLFEQLYVNGRRAERGKFPDIGFYNPVSIQETIIKPNKNSEGDSALLIIKVPSPCYLVLSSLSQEELSRTIVKICHNWDNTIRPIQTFNKQDSTITVVGQAMKPWNKITSQSIFTIENFKSALDKPGEWFLEQNGTLYYKPQTGDLIRTVKAIAPMIEKLVVISGDTQTGEHVSKVNFKNISFQCTGYWLPKNGFEPSQAAVVAPAQIEADFADHITFSDCEFRHTGSYAVWFRRSCKESILEHNFFQDLGAGGIKIGEEFVAKDSSLITHDITVNNNILHSGGRLLSCAVGIAILNGYNNKLIHNEIGNFRYTGISVGYVWGYGKSPSVNNLIAYNHIHHLGWGEMSDMGGIYLLGISPGTVVRNNLIHDIYALDYGGWGIYTDEGSSDILIRDNLVYRCKSAGFHQHYGKDNLITNNIFANNYKSQLQATREEKHRSFTFRNNIIAYSDGELLSGNWDKLIMDSDSNDYWTGQERKVLFKKDNFTNWQDKGKDINSLSENPDFVDPQTGNYKITNEELLKKIKFQPIDYTQAGVYGSAIWQQKALLSEKTLRAFDKVVK